MSRAQSDDAAIDPADLDITQEDLDAVMRYRTDLNTWIQSVENAGTLGEMIAKSQTPPSMPDLDDAAADIIDWDAACARGRLVVMIETRSAQFGGTSSGRA